MRIAEDLIWQLQGEPLGSVVEQAMQGQTSAAQTSAAQTRAGQPQRFAHVVNLFLRDGDLSSDQFETVAAIGRAQRTSDIETIAVVVADAADHAQLQSLVEPLVANCHVVTATFAGPMPEVFEILLAAATVLNPTDHVVFTNADICPVPSFYDAVAQLLAGGAQSLVINRRSTFGFWPGEPAAALAAFSLGAAHPGFDCFVFAHNKLPEMVVTDSVVGSPYVMLSVLFNLVAVSSPLVVLTDAHLTYHFGDDRAWSSDGRNELVDRNLRAATAVRQGHQDRADNDDASDGSRRLADFFRAFENWIPENIGRS